MTKRKTIKPVKAWAIVSKRGIIQYSSAYKSKYEAERDLWSLEDRIIRVLITPIKKGRKNNT